MRKYIPINRILLTLLITITVGIVIFTYLHAFQNNPPIEFYNLPFPTDKQQYTHGEDIKITAEYCRYTDVPYTLNLRFVDGLIFVVPEYRRTGASEGCDTVTFIIAKVPEQLPPGTYYLHGKNEYQVNEFATRLVEWTSQKFEVTP